MEPETTGQNTPEVKRDEKGHFLPGTPSPNPEGRPKGSLSLIGLLKAKLESVPDGQKLSYAEALIAKIISGAIVDGNDSDKRLIMNYIEGLPKQPVQLDVDKDSLSELTQFFRAIGNAKQNDGGKSEGV